MRFGERSRSGTSVSGWTKRGAGAFSPIAATGGNTVGSYSLLGTTYYYHKFTATGSFVVSSLGSNPFVEYLLVAAGGSGNSGLGGAGGLVVGFFVPTATTYTITIGAGSAGSNGGNSSIAGSSLTTITANGGGRGGGTYENGFPGGSGGGAGGGNNVNSPNGGAPTQTSPTNGRGYGNYGGNAYNNTDAGTGGGAGGSGNGSKNQGYVAGPPLYFSFDNGVETAYARGGESPVGTNNGSGSFSGAGSSGVCIVRYRFV